LGREVHATRRRLRLTQAALAARIGLHQTWISDIELGRAGAVPLDTWIALGVALGRPLAVSFSRAIDPALRDPVDAGHLEIQEALLELAARTGREAVAELPTRPADPRHSVDIALRDDTHRVLILAEAWNTFGDVGAAIRSTHRKQSQAEELAVVLSEDGAPYRVATVWIVRATAANRSLIARYPHLFATTFDGSSRHWASAMTGGGPPPARPGLVWFDSSGRRLTAWRRHPA
jgi:transcriptional regulator with XRE-family HTH domain